MEEEFITSGNWKGKLRMRLRVVTVINGDSGVEVNWFVPSRATPEPRSVPAASEAEAPGSAGCDCALDAIPLPAVCAADNMVTVCGRGGTQEAHVMYPVLVKRARQSARLHPQCLLSAAAGA